MPNSSLHSARPRKRKLSWRSRILFFLLGLALPYFAAQAVVAHLFTQRFAREIGAAPDGQLPGAAEIFFTTADGLRLAGWYAPAAAAPATKPGPAVILSHGHAGDRRQMLARAGLLQRQGFAVLLYDARAHGESDGARTSIGYHERHDVVAAFAYLRGRGHGEIGAIGMSQGAATLALAAEELPELRWAVLENCYSSLEETFDGRCRAWCGLPRWLIAPCVLPVARHLVGLPSSMKTPVEAAKDFRCPVLVLCGEADLFITPEQTRAIYEAIPTRKGLHLTPGAGHVDLYAREPEAYEKRLLEFLNSNCPRHGTSEM